MPEQRGRISEYQSGKDLVVEWRISNFFSLSEEDNARYWSPSFSFAGERWCLEIRPNGSSGYVKLYGNDMGTSSGYVDLFLIKYDSDRSVTLSFSLSLKTAKGGKYHEEHCTNDFLDDFSDIHEFNRFIQRSELTMKSSELVPEGVLTVVCTMKNTTPAESDSTGFTQLQGWNVSGNYAFGYGGQGYGYNQGGYGNYGQGGNDSRTRAGNDSEYAYVVASKQHAGASTQREGASTQREEASTLTVEASTQTVEASTQTVEAKCEACASGSSIGPLDDELCHDLKELFLKKEDCDIIIKVKDSEFPAHRIILKARSPVFASTFRHNMKENATGIVEIDDCDPSSFSDFLCFLYCGDATLISQENVFGLFTAADKYQILNLRLKCLEFIKENLTVDTFCETITLALRHSETELIKLCTDYFKKNVPKIIVTVKWQTFLAENPTESNELLVKFFVPNSN